MSNIERDPVFNVHYRRLPVQPVRYLLTVLRCPSRAELRAVSLNLQGFQVCTISFWQMVGHSKRSRRVLTYFPSRHKKLHALPELS